MKTIILFADLKKKRMQSVVQGLENYLGRRKIRVLVNEVSPDAELVVAVGGDGTILRAARQVSRLGLPILGVNLGEFGFLAGVNSDSVYSVMDSVLRGQFKVGERMLLSSEVIRRKRPLAKFLALNDVVIKNGTAARVIRLKLEVNGQFVTTYVGDGLIVASPTGSTAYSLAANGPIVHPDLSLIILSPICPHTLALRPLLISSKDVVDIWVEANHHEVILTMDGQENFPLELGDLIRVRKARQKLRMVLPASENYFQILRRKLKWGMR